MLRDHVPSLALKLGPKNCPVSFPGATRLPIPPLWQDTTNQLWLTHLCSETKTLLDLAECKSCSTVRVQDWLCRWSWNWISCFRLSYPCPRSLAEIGWLWALLNRLSCLGRITEVQTKGWLPAGMMVVPSNQRIWTGLYHLVPVTIQVILNPNFNTKSTRISNMIQMIQHVPWKRWVEHKQGRFTRGEQEQMG